MSDLNLRSARSGPLAAGVVLALLLAGTGAAYIFLFYESRYTCDRASDSCQVVEVNRLRREVTHEFRPSKVAQVRLERGKRRSCAVVTMKGGAEAVWICPVHEEYVPLVNEFIGDSARDRLDYRVEASIVELASLGLVASLMVFPLFGAASKAIRRLRP